MKFNNVTTSTLQILKNKYQCHNSQGQKGMLIIFCTNETQIDVEIYSDLISQNVTIFN